MSLPKIELRKVSHSKSLSEETPAYTAQVWVDGVHFADVSNHGHGGCDSVNPPRGTAPNDPAFHKALAALEARIVAEFPKSTFDFGRGPQTFDASFESVCQGLLGEIEVQRHVDRALKAKVMWLRDGKVFQVTRKSLEAGRHTVEQFVAVVRAKEPGARFLHEMPRDEAAKHLVA